MGPPLLPPDVCSHIRVRGSKNQECCRNQAELQIEDGVRHRFCWIREQKSNPGEHVHPEPKPHHRQEAGECSRWNGVCDAEQTQVECAVQACEQPETNVCAASMPGKANSEGDSRIQTLNALDSSQKNIASSICSSQAYISLSTGSAGGTWGRCNSQWSAASTCWWSPTN